MISKTVQDIHVAANLSVEANRRYSEIVEVAVATQGVTRDIAVAMQQQKAATDQINGSLEQLMNISQELRESASEQSEINQYLGETVDQFARVAKEAYVCSNEIFLKRFRMNDAVNRLGRITLFNRSLTGKL
jgi:methyl-accepting chemotaxis protein